MRKFHVALTFLALIGATVSQALVLDMTKLPSQQGWSYMADGNRVGIAESAAFSVAGGVLQQTLVGQSYGSVGYLVYSTANPYADTDFVVSANLRITGQEHVNPLSPYGMAVGVATNYGYAMIGVAGDRLAMYKGATYMFDGTQAHDIVMVGHKSTQTLDVFVDGQKVMADQVLPVVSSNLGLFFADATGYTNNNAVLGGYAAVPEPATGLLALGLIPILRLRKRGK